MNLLIVIGLISYLNVKTCVSACGGHQTCGACIGHAEERCVWCSQENVTEPRCRPENDHKATKSWCKADFTINPEPTKDVEINGDFNKMVQFRPQLLKVKARPGIPVKFVTSYKPAEQYPIDVYFLMDFSDTMRNHKRELETQAMTIYKELTALTNNVRLGVGSFVEKPGLPYADITLRNSNSYSFTNHLPLTNNTALFKSTVQEAAFGGNYDDPESGLDALMQAMACEEEVGWRKDSRRIIVLCTDNTYHSAGDGKMLGAITPNDMRCHLRNKTYGPPDVLKYDYPSVSQINRVAKNGKFQIIFAAVMELSTEYNILAKQILGATYAELKENNVVNIIKQAYLDSVRDVRLTYDQLPFVHVQFDQDCDSSPRRNCESTHQNSVVEVTATLTILNCGNEGNNSTRRITVSPVRLSDTLVIEIETDCTCECEKVKSGLSEKCNHSGFIQCGICNCNPDRAGAECQCDANSADKTNGYDTCKKSKSSADCSGRGTCRCGICEDCMSGFSGKFCEYDDSMCPKHKEKICSGHGSCTEGSCKCDEYWLLGEQKDCSCPVGNEGCIGLYSKEVCSGHGTCKCGACICNEVEGKNETYSGKFCHSCGDCGVKLCKKLEEYSHCYIMNDKATCDEMYKNISVTTVLLVNKTEISTTWRSAIWCKKLLEDGSLIIFKYYINSITGELTLIIQKEPQLPPKANIWVAVGSAIGLILLIGLLTGVAWKILIDNHDKREYDKFCKKAKAEGFDVGITNDLYQSPEVNFINPIYNRSGNQS